MITPTTYPGFGFNLLCPAGNGGILNPDIRKQADGYLAELWDQGVRRIRTGVPPYSYVGTPTTDYPIQGLALSRLWAKYVHDKGFHVIHGVTSISSAAVVYQGSQYNGWFSGTNVDYPRGVLAEAQWAQDNGIDEFCIGNEEGLHVDYTAVDAAITADTVTYPDAPSQTLAKNNAHGNIRQSIRNDVRTLATQVQSIFTIGPVCYSNSEGEATNTYGGGWITDYATTGMGGLDRIDFNMYDTVPLFRSHLVRNLAAIPLQYVGITELNNDDGYRNSGSLGGTYGIVGREEESWAKDMAQRVQVCKDLNIPSVFFFSMNQFPFSYAMRDDATNNYRLAYDSVMAVAFAKRKRYAI